MKAYLITTGTIFALFSVSHFFITFEQWRAPSRDLWSVGLPACIAVGAAALTFWAVRLSRPTATSP